ncbi:MAG TPA: 50S ribosomal protein L25 [Candidatus Magasanikbacteria bacterium]|nr:50S ribosomal protein L25 [Candidatus Magasanikbacteria bacterium]
MSNLTLNAQKRSEDLKMKDLREARKIPAVVYGHGFKNLNIVLEYLNFERVYQQVGFSGLVDLVIEGEKPLKVLIQDFQLDPLTNKFTHADLHTVKMDEKIKTEIKLSFVGEAPAVKGLGGTLVKSFSELPAECLPQDLVNEIAVDISSLKEFGSVIHVKDVVVSKGIKILANPDDVIVTVVESKVEDEAVAPVADLSQIKTEAEEKREKKAAEKKEEETK